MSSLDKMFEMAGNACYGGLALVALWGGYCLVIVWMRLAQLRFRNEDAQQQFIGEIAGPLAKGDFQSVVQLCQGDRRAIPQLVLLAMNERAAGYVKARQIVLDRFQRDVLTEIEHRLSWVSTVIKSAPMLGLYGTVLGMMGAFGQLASQSTVQSSDLAKNIMLALITTALGLTIAIPLMILLNSVLIRMRQFESSVGAGLADFFELYRTALMRTPSAR